MMIEYDGPMATGFMFRCAHWSSTRETIVEYETAVVSFRLLLKETREKRCDERIDADVNAKCKLPHTHGCDTERYGDTPV